jgi:hypothetical protein
MQISSDPRFNNAVTQVSVCVRESVCVPFASYTSSFRPHARVASGRIH